MTKDCSSWWLSSCPGWSICCPYQTCNKYSCFSVWNVSGCHWIFFFCAFAWRSVNIQYCFSCQPASLWSSLCASDSSMAHRNNICVRRIRTASVWTLCPEDSAASSQTVRDSQLWYVLTEKARGTEFHLCKRSRFEKTVFFVSFLPCCFAFFFTLSCFCSLTTNATLFRVLPGIHAPITITSDSNV